MIFRKSAENHDHYFVLGFFIYPADVFISMEKDAEASACVQEAHLIFPMSPDVLFQVCCYLSTKPFVHRIQHSKLEPETQI